ncbi:P-loop containing nucleoside triphosphate hydrolases superfamily protein [Striga hermonthica]|uniref:P-loop containing nucleoside triphosphate hydrolases superfamily protein n=1 Tax=Striga hermonthica TaxID=68872 RepID=A0A9N7RBE5_STRHE|nr:P-loop containing nucleoside triphosphate hydrolases superfamily protein [Striga hermonthica]
MNCTWSLFQLRQTSTSTSSLLFRSYNNPKGAKFVPQKFIHPTLCFCQQMQTTAYEIVNGSYVPAVDTNQSSSKIKDKVVKKPLETVGAFQKLPMVMPSVDILYSALRKAKRVSATKGIANAAKRERNKGAKQLDALMKELAVPLRTYKENFPDKKDLHPYERSLIELTLGDGNYEEVLGKVDTLRKKLVSVGKEHASFCAKSHTKREAEERLSEGMKKIEEIFNNEGEAVDELLHIAKTLRAMPVVDLETPTLCLIGSPNVGKSSLVRLLSTGKPEVCNYPFTTRGILMGHMTLSYQNFQVTDTPGLLRRHDEKRNNLEKLTLAVLSHLPTAVLYVHDLSGECGTSPSDQFIIYNEVKARFGDHLWLDVVSKCDLLNDSPVVFVTEDSRADNVELAKYRTVGPEGAIRVSIKDELGIREIRTAEFNGSFDHEVIWVALLDVPDGFEGNATLPADHAWLSETFVWTFFWSNSLKTYFNLSLSGANCIIWLSVDATSPTAAGVDAGSSSQVVDPQASVTVPELTPIPPTELS